MVNISRSDINDYLYNLFYEVVTKNVYLIDVPTELTNSDTKDGFLVISIGTLNDESEFFKQTYGWVRCFVEVYVPVLSRGRFNRAKYKAFEDAVNEVIENEIANPTSEVYSIQNGSTLSADDDEGSNPDNRFTMFIRSFIVNIDQIN